VALISAALWQRRFGRDPDILGKAIDLEGPQFLSNSSGRYTVIGVLPPTFWLFHPRAADVIVPMQASASQMADPTQRLVESTIGRLTESPPEHAQADISAIASRFQANLPLVERSPSTIEVVALHEEQVGDLRRPLLLLFGSALSATLIACVNVSLVLLARGNVRRREFAIRMGLGAGRARVLTQMLAESLVLSTIGGVIGLLVANWALRLIAVVIPSQVLSRLAGPDRRARRIRRRPAPLVALRWE
jgi:putative ABC transport system permease protein